MPGQRAGTFKKQGCVEIALYSRHWPCLFPQHGPGRKHTRRIALEPWQQALVDHYRKAATARLDTFIGPKDRAVPLNGVHYAA